MTLIKEHWGPRDDLFWERYILHQDADVLGFEICNAYKSKNYQFIIYKIKSDYSKIQNIPPIERSMLGLSLVKLGNISEGLRELSLAYELIPKSKSYEEFLISIHLLLGFSLAGEREIVESLYTTIKLSNHHKTYLELSRIQSMIPNDDISNDFTINYGGFQRLIIPPINYLDENSLKGRLIRYHKIILKASDLLLETETQDLDWIFNSIIDLMPLPSLEPIFRAKSKIFEIEDQWFSTNLNSPFIKIDELDRLKILKTDENLIELNKIMKIKTITSFILLHEKLYNQAHNGFKWVLNLYSNVLKKLFKNDYNILEKYEILKNTFSTESMRSINLLSAYSMMNEPNNNIHHIINSNNINSTNSGSSISNNFIMKIDHYLSNIINLSDGITTEEERKTGKLEHYFLIIASLYFEKIIITSNNENQMKFMNLMELEGIIRKLIIVSTLKLNDDSYNIQIYDFLITALLLYGGLNIRTVWAFNFFKNSFKLNLSINESLLPKLDYKLCDFIEEFISSSQTLRKSFECKELPLKDEEKQILFSNMNSNEVINKSTLPMTRFIKINRDGVKLVINPERNLSNIEICDRLRKSDEFINLWLESFKNYHENEDINDILTYLKTLQFDI
ncbi:hypothetical protein WICMUC_005780 [Wickerhamomyces mucosus]|uniref:Uncharacterized protein n=1 Tax=Wickerhamomyces mucosus TaxID=1378264 RepID=A0A9P8P367_9ASCO|nr:hypothetical protein WICMUC_005780 [Wickerhamomyces mucosus]